MERTPVLILYGPTAVGKTAITEALASIPIEVISADSMQVYRGMDIGTAKPDADLRARIPHHLIDIRNPDERYDVGAFVEDADALFPAIRARGALPVVSGGTAFYLKHLLLGLPQTPPADPEVRARVSERAARLTPEALHAELNAVDPVSAERIAVNDTYRATRALEVWEQTQRPLSSFSISAGTREDLNVAIVSLDRPRAEIRGRIAGRVDAMLAAGLRREVEVLVDAGYGPDDPGMRAIGYREFFSGTAAIRPTSDDAAIRDEIIVSTRRYAKRQSTFFRQLAGWVSVIELDPGDGEALRAVASRLATR